MSKLYIIRHAESIYNKIRAEIEKQSLPFTSASFYLDITLSDSPLSATGITQGIKAASLAHSLPIKSVFVSPLKRALQTCQLLFENHPLHPKIIIHPFLLEGLHTVCDISSYAGTAFPEFSHFDWSLMPNFFLPEIILHEKYSSQLRMLSFDEKIKKLLEFMRKILPDSIESREEIYERAQKTKEIWKKESKGGSVALVGHSAFFQEFTKTSFNEQGIWLENCQIYEYNLMQHK